MSAAACREPRRGRVVAVAVATSVLLVAVVAEAGWERQRMNIQDEDKGFLDICAVAPDFVIAPGVIKAGSSDAGAIMASLDGATWSAVTPPTSGGPMDMHMYLSCWFADRQHGYVGALGELWVTDDGASSWTRVGLGGLFGGKAVNDLHGLRGGPAWAATSTGDLLRTEDGGVTWPEVGQPLGGVSLTKVVFVDGDHGWVASGGTLTDEETGAVIGYEEGGLALTTDGGATWEVVFSGEPRQVMALRALDARRLFMISSATTGPRLEQSSDGGGTWEAVAIPTETTIGAVTGLADVYFFDGCEGWLLGSAGDNDAGVLWRTLDGGQSWIEEEDREALRLGQLLGFPIEAGLIHFDFVDRSVGFASGTYETIFRYDAADGPPDCDDGGGPDPDGGPDDGDGDGGARCECRAGGGGPGDAAVSALAALVLFLSAGFARRRWRS